MTHFVLYIGQLKCGSKLKTAVAAYSFIQGWTRKTEGKGTISQKIELQVVYQVIHLV